MIILNAKDSKGNIIRTVKLEDSTHIASWIETFLYNNLVVEVKSIN